MSETVEQTQTPTPPPPKAKHLPEVAMVRTMKEYIGESILIVFSVVLALLLTELLNSMHEKSRAAEILKQLREELIANKAVEEKQYAYHQQVLQNIDSALAHLEFAKQFIDSGKINLKVLAPQGVMSGDLNDVSWKTAQQNNVFAKIDLDTYKLLTDIYEQQQRIGKTEEEVAHVLLSWESRKPENLKTTLILMSNNYHGWAVDRVPNLLHLYAEAIDKLKAY
jgi:hypothetical protein